MRFSYDVFRSDTVHVHRAISEEITGPKNALFGPEKTERNIFRSAWQRSLQTHCFAPKNSIRKAQFRSMSYEK